MTVVLIGFAILLLLIIGLRLPIAIAMGLVGFFGFAVLQGLTLDTLFTFNWKAALTLASNRITETVQDYGLSVIPLFIL
nr:hypothetical protein [Thiolinea sp.]